jgi:hypothetical protein
MQDEAVEGWEPINGQQVAEPADPVTLGDPYHLSRGARAFLRFVAVVLVFTMTALFLEGVINTIW